MEEDKKEIVENDITDQGKINNDGVLIEEEKSNQENNVIKNDVKENETKKESSNVKSIVIILILFIILVGAGVYGLFLVSKEESNSNKDNNNEITDNNIQEEVPTFNDDVVDEEVNDNVEIENNIINIYQKGYAEKGPIAFTYECKSEDCDIKVIDKGFILYDEEVVKYREMTSYEYEQINNSEISPIGSKLDMDGFVEVESVADDNEDMVAWELSKIYLIKDQVFSFNDESDYILKLVTDEILFYS